MDAAHAGVAGWVASFKMSPGRRFQSDALGVVGRHVGDGVFQSGADGVELADGGAGVLHFQKGGTQRGRPRDERGGGAEFVAGGGNDSHHHRAGHRAVFGVSRFDRAGADCGGVFVRGVAGLLPRDRRDGHHAHRRGGQADAVALRRAAGRARASPPRT